MHKICQKCCIRNARKSKALIKIGTRYYTQILISIKGLNELGPSLLKVFSVHLHKRSRMTKPVFYMQLSWYLSPWNENLKTKDEWYSCTLFNFLYFWEPEANLIFRFFKRNEVQWKSKHFLQKRSAHRYFNPCWQVSRGLHAETGWVMPCFVLTLLKTAAIKCFTVSHLFQHFGKIFVWIEDYKVVQRCYISMDLSTYDRKNIFHILIADEPEWCFRVSR